MQSETPRFSGKSRNIGRSTLIVTISFLLALGAVVSHAVQHHYFSGFEFNFYAVLSLLPIAVNIFIIFMIMRLRGRSEEAVWFVLYLCGITVAGLGEAFQRLSTSPEAAVYWFQFNGLGFILMPIAYYLFVFAYVRPLRMQSPLLIPSLLTSASVMVFFFVATNQFYNLDPQALVTYPWGLNPPTGPLFPILLAWVEMLLFVAFITLVHFYRHVTSDLLRRQSRVYIWAILIPIIGGSISDGILPLLDINVVVPLSIFLSTCTSVVAYYGLRRYRLFQINPTIFAENVIRTMNEAVIVTNKQYRIDFVNREAERLLGTPSQDLSGRDIGGLFDTGSWKAISRFSGNSGNSRAGDTDIGKLQVVNRSGENIPVRVYTSRLDEGSDTEAYIFIISDISDITASYHQLELSAERIRSQYSQLQENQVTMQRLLQESKDLQKQLQHEKENVEHTVEVRTAELREARDKLKASDEMKSEFIMLSSHNLRTPLAIMKSSVELLADNEALTEQQKYMVHALTSSTDRLGEFVEDLLTIATLEAGDQLKLVPTRLDEITIPLIQETKAMAVAKGLDFQFTIDSKDVRISANTLRLRGAIRNILHNAVNFTSKGGVHLHIRHTSSLVTIVVEDSGIGIAPEELPRMFTKFHRGSSALTYNYQGVGIGLYLTKLVVEEHHGQITVKSKPGEGSAFTITLPVAQD